MESLLSKMSNPYYPAGVTEFDIDSIGEPWFAAQLGDEAYLCCECDERHDAKNEFYDLHQVYSYDRNCIIDSGRTE